MQEVMKDGSEGRAIVKDTIEDLLPYIKKSLEDPNVKFVKVFKNDKYLREGMNKFVAEEEKAPEMVGAICDDFKAAVEKKKKAQLKIPGRR